MHAGVQPCHCTRACSPPGAPACLLATFRTCASGGPGARRRALLTAGTSARDDPLRCGGCDVLTRIAANAARGAPESPPSVVSGYCVSKERLRRAGTGTHEAAACDRPERGQRAVTSTAPCSLQRSEERAAGWRHLYCLRPPCPRDACSSPKD